MTEIAIRPFGDEDRAALIALWHRGWHDAHAALVPPDVLEWRRPEHFALWLDAAGDRFWVAERGGLLGFVSTGGDELVRLFVDRAARGTGVAARLLAYGEGMIRAAGHGEAVLHCTAGNRRAERFYERHGWTLARTYDDALWLPDGAGPVVATGEFRKRLGAVPAG